MKARMLLLFAVMLSLRATSQVVANFTANPTVLCPGGQVQFTDLSTGSPTIWSWSFPGGTPLTSTLQNPIVTYNTPGQYNVSLSASNGGLPGTNTTFSYITVTSMPPGPGLISGQFTVCQRQPSSFTIAPVANAISYSWTATSSATILTGQGSNSITLATGALVTTLCVSAGNACGYGPATCSVIVSPASPTISVSPSATTICEGSSVTLTASGASSYSWSPPGGLSSTSGSSVIASPTTNVNYTVTGTGASGCTGTAIAQVSVILSPTVSVSPSAAVICPGGSVSLVASGASTYSWNPSTGLSSTSGATVVASPSTSTTYTVVGTGTNSCRGSAVANVTVTASSPPTPGLITGPPLACAGLTGNFSISPVSNASTYSWTVPSGAVILSGQGTTLVLVSFSSSGGNICVSAGNGCGYSSNSCLPILPLAQPTVAVNPSSATICAGSSVTLAASGASSYTWSPSTGLNSTNTASVIASPAASIVYTVRGTASSGCSGTATVDVVVNTAPTITINPAFPSICTGGSVSITASGASTYTWSPGTGLSSTSGSAVVANPAVTTSYTIAATAANGCTNTAGVTVSVASSPPALAGTPAGPGSVCSGNVASYSISPAAGAASYTWTAPAGAQVISGQGSTMVTIQFAGSSGNVCVSGINGCGPGAAVCSSVTVIPSPVVVVTPASATICAGSFVTLSASGASTYSWSPSVAISSNTMATIVAGPSNDITYSVTGTAANGCTGTASVSVKVNPLPQVNITSNAPSICSNGSATLTASGASSYTWSPAGSLSSSNGSTVVAQPTVSTTYSVSGTSSLGCQNQSAFTLKVYSAPPSAPLGVSGTATLCASDVATYSINEVANADTYSWTVPSGYTILSGQGSTIISVSGGAVNASICVTAMNACGSSGPSCINIEAFANPVVNVTSGGPACAGNTIALTASGAASYSWNPATGLSSTSGATVSAGASAAGIVTVTGTSSSGCMATATIEVIFLQPPSAPVISGPSELCPSSVAQFTLNPEAGSTYSWTRTGNLSINSQGNSTVEILVSGSGTLCAVGQNSCGMGTQACVQVIAKSVAQLTLTSTGSVTCLSPTATLMFVSSASNITHVWGGPGGFASTAPTPTINLPGTYAVVATHLSSGCNSTFTLVVPGNVTKPAFTASIIPAECMETVSKDNGRIIISSQPATNRFILFQGSSITGEPAYSGASTIQAGGIITSTLVNPTTDQPYALRILTPEGCRNDTLLTLKAISCDNGLFVPQAFTPDGDGKNDLFVISGLPTGGDNAVTVFNRWGSKVFQQDDYDNTWDGRSNVSGGDKLPRGTYYYILEFKGRDLKPVTGFIVIQY
jgi:gliding motility-associated-like protein